MTPCFSATSRWILSVFRTLLIVGRDVLVGLLVFPWKIRIKSLPHDGKNRRTADTFHALWLCEKSEPAAGVPFLLTFVISHAGRYYREYRHGKWNHCIHSTHWAASAIKKHHPGSSSLCFPITLRWVIGIIVDSMYSGIIMAVLFLWRQFLTEIWRFCSCTGMTSCFLTSVGLTSIERTQIHPSSDCWSSSNGNL